MEFLFSEDKICITGALGAPVENSLKIVKKKTGGVELAYFWRQLSSSKKSVSAALVMYYRKGSSLELFKG
jgi:hypothetical protein